MSANDCPKDLPACEPTAHICVGCIIDFVTCSAGLTCNGATHTCVPLDPNAPCKKTPDCPRPGLDSMDKLVCEVDAGICLGCLANGDCTLPKVCIQRLHICDPDFCKECDPATQVCDLPNRRCLPGDGGI
jgi:hypothetical protein